MNGMKDIGRATDEHRRRQFEVLEIRKQAQVVTTTYGYACNTTYSIDKKVLLLYIVDNRQRSII